MSIPPQPQPSYKNSPLQPVSLTPEQKELCKRLDALYGPYAKFKASASEMFQGALVAMDRSDGNPDWVAQAAHSLREIIYPLWSRRSTAVPDKKAKAFENYGSVNVNQAVTSEIGRIYNKLSDLAHHSLEMSKHDFQKLLAGFETIMLRALTRQIDLHKKIDAFVSSRP